MILNASAENGSASSARRCVGRPAGSLPATAGTSVGDGRKSTIASSSGCTPLFLNAAPTSTGTARPATVARRSAARRNAPSTSRSSR